MPYPDPINRHTLSLGNFTVEVTWSRHHGFLFDLLPTPGARQGVAVTPAQVRAMLRLSGSDAQLTAAVTRLLDLAAPGRKTVRLPRLNRPGLSRPRVQTRRAV